MEKKIKDLLYISIFSLCSFVLSGCYGTFSLTSKLHRWNSEATGSKFGNECIFIALCIIPAYELCALGDALIFNSVEFWGGNNPISMKAGKVEQSEIIHNGSTYQLVRSRNCLTIKSESTFETFRYFSEEKVWYQMNGDKKIKVVEIQPNNVLAYLPDGQTLSLNHENVKNIEIELSTK